MGEVLEALQHFLTCNRPVVKLAAIKTSIELAGEANEEVVAPYLIKLLNDPEKIIREEAKTGLEILTGGFSLMPCHPQILKPSLFS